MRAAIVTLLAAGAMTTLGTAQLKPVTVTATWRDTAVVAVARWQDWCAGRDCGDTLRLEWYAAPRRPIVQHRRPTDAADTLTVPVATGARTLRVQLVLSAMRRGVVVSRTTVRIDVAKPARRPTPAPPMPVTVVDSYPTLTLRDTLGRRDIAAAPGGTVAFCAFSRNRFTGRVVHRMPEGATTDAWRAIQQRCERARQMFEAERSA